MVTIRRAEHSDAAAIAALYAPYVLDSVITFETEAPGPAIMAARIAGCLEAQLPYIVATDDGGAVIGYAYAGYFNSRCAYRYTVEPTVYLQQNMGGRGIGSALYDRLLALLKALGYLQAIAKVAVPNAASEALHRRFGFHQAGVLTNSGFKFGKWIDVALFQKSLVAHMPENPADPLPLNASALWTAMP